MEIKLIYVTLGSPDEAKTLARTLVDERLVACANILGGVLSVYRWEGRVCEEAETILILKTRADRVEAVIERIRGLHSYSCPCIVVLPVQGGNNQFLQWVETESSPS